MYALVGSRNFANAWIAVASVSKFLTDPLLFVLCNMARLIRRLYDRSPELAAKFLQLSFDFQGSRPFGPATAFNKYCSLVGWQFTADGTLQCSTALKCHLFNDPLPNILRTLRRAWPMVLIQNVDRKGVGDYIPNLELTQKVFSAFSDDDQKLLSFYFLGSFQVSTIKAKWNADEVPECPLCGLPDTRPHRYLECEAFSLLRTQFSDAVGILASERNEWMYIPLARAAEDQELALTVRNTFPVPMDVKPFQVQADSTTFFTDGGAFFPQYEDARLASWAVVQDTATSIECQRRAADFAFCTEPRYPTIKTISLGLVPGMQTASRGELFALLVALRAAVQLPAQMHIRFVTDAQYVIVTVNKLSRLGISWVSYKTPHADIIFQIHALWDDSRFHIEKVKSHVDLHKASSFHQLYQMIGNKCADLAATASLKKAPSAILQLCQNQKDWYIREKAWLVEVCRYVLAINRLRIKLLDDHAKSAASQDRPAPSADGVMSARIYGIDAFNILCNYVPDHFVSICDQELMPATDVLQAFLQGATTALALCKWAQTLTWPPDIQASYRSDADWGITWMELYMNFLCVTGIHMPIKTSGSGYNTVMVDFQSDQGMLLPKSKRSLAAQTTCFQRSIAALNNLTGTRWFPCFDSGHVTSLKHLGWNVQACGIPCRPGMQYVVESMTLVHKLVPGPQFKSNLSEHVVYPNVPPLIHVQCQVDVPMKTKWRLYLEKMKTRRNNAGDDA